MQRPTPIPRRSHKKSKGGCKACKERRVKCDETRPVCRKCAVHFTNVTECDYGQFDDPGDVEQMASQAESSSSAAQQIGSEQAALERSLPIRRVNSVSPSLLDPFKAYPECDEPDTDSLMKTFFARHIYNIFPYYPTPRLNPVIEYFAPVISKDPVLLHVSLLCVALQNERHLSPKDRTRSRRLNAKSLRLLQRRINSESPDCISDTTLCAIAALTNIENSKGNLRHAHTHLAGLKRILDIRGGLDAVRSSNATIANIVFCAMISAADSSFPIQDLQRPLKRPDWFWQAVQDDAAEPCIDLKAHGVDNEYADIMLNIRMMAKTYQTADDCRSTGEYQAVLTFLTSTLQRLLSLPLPQTPETYEGRITAACRYALIVHVFAQWCGHDPDPHLMVSLAQHELLTVLRPLMEHRVSNTLLVWLLSVGGTAPIGLAERKWFIGHLADVTEDLGIKTWLDMRSRLKQVIWHNHQDEEMHKGLWDEVESRQVNEQELQAPDVDL